MKRGGRIDVDDGDDDEDDDDTSQYEDLCDESFWQRLGGILVPSRGPPGGHFGGLDVVDRSRSQETLCHLCVHIARSYAVPPMCPHSASWCAVPVQGCSCRDDDQASCLDQGSVAACSARKRRSIRDFWNGEKDG